MKSLDHPNVIKILDHYESEEYHYIFMELFPMTLLDKLNEEEQLSENVVRCIIKQILKALEYIHSKNIIHRDLKLENIVIKENKDSFSD